MARKKDNTMLYLLIGAGVFLFMTHRRQTTVQNYPPQPNTYAGSPEWLNWARQIITLAGGLTQTLFGPGGPFAGKDPAEIAAATGSNDFYA